VSNTIDLPLYKATFDGSDWFLPPCNGNSTTLFKSDGTKFTLFCDHIEADGVVWNLPSDDELNPAKTKQCVTANGVSVCFWKHFDDTGCTASTSTSTTLSVSIETCTEDPTDTIATPSSAQPTPTPPPTLDTIAANLASSVGATGQVACGAAAPIAAYCGLHFSMALLPQNIADQGDDYIKGFFNTALGNTRDFNAAVTTWLDQVEQSFIDLLCYVDTADGHRSRIWRAMTEVK
jgi:hypothetical protein